MLAKKQCFCYVFFSSFLYCFLLSNEFEKQWPKLICQRSVLAVRIEKLKTLKELSFL